MKWFKHLSASWADEGLAKLVGKGGMEGLARYGLWWRVLEIVADQLEPKGGDPSVSYSVTRWSTLLSLRGSLVFSTLSTLGVTGGVSVTRDGDDIRVTIPNLLKYRDEYSRKSGHAPENVIPRTEQKENRTEIQDEGITSSMVSSAVLDDLRLSGDRLRMVLDDVCHREMKIGTSADRLREQLVGSYHRYQQAKERLAYAVGAERFFAELWHNPATWPWREGEFPRPVLAPSSEQGIHRPNRVINLREVGAKAGIQ